VSASNKAAATAADPVLQQDLANAECLIERQFPVARLSMESYKERSAKQSQTLTGLGKWWGRKPLVLVRACLLALLIPPSDCAELDRDILLKLMTMDAEGLRRRKNKSIRADRIIAELAEAPPSFRNRFDDPASPQDRSLIKKLTASERTELQAWTFDRMPYREKLEYCARPEQIDGPSSEAWREINAHLGTSANDLQDLIVELGIRRFGHRPRVGDTFCGGGSIPFEAARLGCEAYGSDLSPIAALLTWAALNIVGGGKQIVQRIRRAQEEVFAAADRQITEWGVEHNEQGWRADAVLYCVEVRDPESGWMIPLAPHWVVSEANQAIAKLIPDAAHKRYQIEIVEGVSSAGMAAARASGTVRNSRLWPPGAEHSTPIEAIRRNMRMWEEDDLVPRPDDVFQERLYCIRWVEKIGGANGAERMRKRFRAPAEADLAREQKCLELLRERFEDWQKRGFIPATKIEPGAKTDEPIRTRGWTHWHHIFTPRQLLMHGLLAEQTTNLVGPGREENVAAALGIGRCANWDSKLCQWILRTIGDISGQTFSNQALNPLFAFMGRGFTALTSSWFLDIDGECVFKSAAEPRDVRSVDWLADIWITDPPYADAINYDELSEYFLTWIGERLCASFPEWYHGSRRALAIKGSTDHFRRAMVECYRKLASCMPDNGLQIVTFTHQDATVWADLALIIWAAGLRVTAAWCIATETDSPQKKGNYVQGTVVMVLRKQTAAKPVYIDDLPFEIEEEVRAQVDAMTSLDDASDPNFGDTDYQLAAYASALRVLTRQPIKNLNPEAELLRERAKGEVNPVENLIRNAVRIACDHLVPRNLDVETWKTLAPLERFYLKGLEVESHGEYRNGVYQELARGFGAPGYSDLLASSKANETRLMTATEMRGRMLEGGEFAGTPLRHVLYAISKCDGGEQVAAGVNWLRTELVDFWNLRTRLIELLDYLARLRVAKPTGHWERDGRAAELLAGALHSAHV
jgi:putative DNA methylase